MGGAAAVDDGRGNRCLIWRGRERGHSRGMYLLTGERRIRFQEKGVVGMLETAEAELFSLERRGELVSDGGALKCKKKFPGAVGL